MLLMIVFFFITFVYFFHLFCLTYQYYMKSKHIQVLPWQQKTEMWVIWMTGVYLLVALLFCQSMEMQNFVAFLTGFLSAVLISGIVCSRADRKVSSEKQYAEICESIEILTEKIDSATNNLTQLRNMSCKRLSVSAKKELNQAIVQHQKVLDSYCEIRDVLMVRKCSLETVIDLNKIVIPEIPEKQNFEKIQKMLFMLHEDNFRDNAVDSIIQKYS